MKGLFLIDLETVPADLPFRAGRIDIPARVPAPDPPASMRRADTIAKWRAERGNAKHRDAYLRESLSPYRCRLAGAAILCADGSGQTIRIAHRDGDSAGVMLGRIATALREERAQAIAHWGGFDRGVLRGQLAACDVSEDSRRFLRWLLDVSSHQGRPWYLRCADVSVWSTARMHDRSGWSLAEVASALGFGGKTGVASDAVASAWVHGDAAGIANRAAEDVRLTAQICAADGILGPLADWYSRI